MSLTDLSGKSVGQYQLQRLLGEGGMGAVYEAYQPSLKRVVALKLLPESLSKQTGYVARFTREAETAALLEHPHIVPIYEYGTADGLSFVAMRLLAGGSLEERIEQQGALPPLVVSRILNQLAGALDYAHGRGVIHRDIKPSNIMFDDHGNAFLVDFGIAKLMEATQSLTQTGATMGTPIFMSPEQWRAEDVSPASDQYSIGVLAYFLLAGKPPFQATTPFAMMHKHINEIPPAVHLVTENPLHTPVSPIIDKAMAKDANDRYPTITDFARAFEQAAERDKTRTGLNTSQTVIMDAPAPPSRMPWIITGITSLLAIGFLVGMLIAISDSGGTETTVDTEALDALNAEITVQVANVIDAESTISAFDAVSTESARDANTTRIAIQDELTVVANDSANLASTSEALVAQNDDLAATSTAVVDGFEATLTQVADEQDDPNELQASFDETQTAIAEDNLATADAYEATVIAQDNSVATLEGIVTVQADEITTLQAQLDAVPTQTSTLTPTATRDAPSSTPTPDATTQADTLSAQVSSASGVYEDSRENSRIIGLLNPGSNFQVLATSTDGLWYQIEFLNSSNQPTLGYILADRVILTEGSPDQLVEFTRDETGSATSGNGASASGGDDTTATVSQQTVLYTEPNLSNSSQTVISVNEQFNVTGVSGDGQWYEISYQTTGGFVTGYVPSANVIILSGSAVTLPVFDK